MYSIYALIVLGLIVLFIAPPLPVIGALDVKIVKSGSMEPSIMTGAVVVVQEASAYALQDVITFTSASADIPTTHRIIGTEKVNGVEYFITKGDANEERDTNLVAPADILGKVVVDVPFVGFILDFARQPTGFALLVGVPALLIIIDEVTKIWREIRKRREPGFGEKEEDSLVVPSSDDDVEPEDFIMPVTRSVPSRTRMMDIKPIENPIKNNQNTFSYIEPERTMSRMSHDIRPRMMTATFGVLMMFVLSGQAWVSGSIAYVTDTETTIGNNLVAQVVDFAVSPSSSQFAVLGGEIDGISSVDVVVTPNNAMTGELVYSLSSMSVGGNATMCDDVSVVANEPLVFAGALTDVVGFDLLFTDPWHLDFSLSGNNTYTPGDRCDISLVFDGYLNDVDGMGGYTDTEIISLAFVSSGPSLELQALSVASASGTSLVVQSLVEEKTPPQANGGGGGGGSADNNGNTEEDQKVEKEVVIETVPEEDEGGEKEVANEESQEEEVVEEEHESEKGSVEEGDEEVVVEDEEVVEVLLEVILVEDDNVSQEEEVIVEEEEVVGEAEEVVEEERVVEQSQNDGSVSEEVIE